MQRIHIVGRKNSGKTTLITQLVAYFASQGVRVGTIKHTHHRHELDTPGKDSYLHREAGAQVVGIIAPNMQAVFVPQRRDEAETDPYATLSPMFSDCDLVLVEGDWEARAIKVEVWRAENHPLPTACERDDIAAVISDDPCVSTLPRWPRSAIACVGQNLLRIASACDAASMR